MQFKDNFSFLWFILRIEFAQLLIISKSKSFDMTFSIISSPDVSYTLQEYQKMFRVSFLGLLFIQWFFLFRSSSGRLALPLIIRTQWSLATEIRIKSPSNGLLQYQCISTTDWMTSCANVLAPRKNNCSWTKRKWKPRSRRPWTSLTASLIFE